MAQLRFFKQNTAPSGERLVAGSIWFNTTDKTIEVYSGSAWEKYAGKLTNATWDTATQKLTINKADGSSIALDFSNIASLSGVQAALTALENKLTPLITAAQGAADAAQAHSNQVADDLVIESGRAAKAEEDLGKRIDEVEADLAQEVTDRTNADSALDGRLTTVEGKVAALSSATHFLGVKDSLDQVTTPAAGDVVIVGNKEYIYDTTKGWVELGDTTEELQRIATAEGKIATLEGKVDVAKVSTAISDAIAALDSEKSSTNGTHVNVTVKEVDGKLDSVTVSENDIASAAALTEAQGKITALETKVGTSNVADQIAAEIQKLDANVDSTGGAKVSVNVVETDGKVTGVTVTESDIASAAALATAEGKITSLEGKVDVAKVSTAISDAVKALDSEKSSNNGEHVNVTVTMTDGKVTNVSIDEDDIASATSLATAEGKITTLEGKVDVAKVSTAISDAIAALDSNATSTDGSHVKVKVTLADGKVTAVNVTETDIASAAALTEAQGKITSLEGRMDTVEAGLQWENFA